jgi:putative transposase
LIVLTYKYRLYPTDAQQRQLDVLLWQGRNLYNAALEQRITTYQKTGKGLKYVDQWAHFRDLRHANPDTLGQLNATSMQQMLRRLDKAFAAFFRRLKRGEKPGFPRFKSLHRFNSLEYKHGDGCKLRFDNTGRALLYVQNVGEIKIKYHRPLPDGATIKHVVIKRRNHKWYVCFQVELAALQPKPSNLGPVGIDVGLMRLLTLSDGTQIDNPRWLHKSLANLRVAQRRLGRRIKGSNRRRKAAQGVARIHEHISNQRRDFWHKVTRWLVDTYGLVAIEDLTLSFMTRNPRLSLSAHDAALGLFRKLLTYKAESAGTQVVAVNPQYTSQVCSGCGEVVAKPLSERIHDCPHCHLRMDRDENAARNILTLALAFESARTGPSGVNVAGCGVRSLRSSPL